MFKKIRHEMTKFMLETANSRMTLKIKPVVDTELEKFSYHEGKKRNMKTKVFLRKKIRTYFPKLKNAWVGRYIGFNFVSDKCYLLKSYRDKPQNHPSRKIKPTWEQKLGWPQTSAMPGDNRINRLSKENVTRILCPVKLTFIHEGKRIQKNSH